MKAELGVGFSAKTSLTRFRRIVYGVFWGPQRLENENLEFYSGHIEREFGRNE
jgi:hypothetical protein